MTIEYFDYEENWKGKYKPGDRVILDHPKYGDENGRMYPVSDAWNEDGVFKYLVWLGDAEETEIEIDEETTRLVTREVLIKLSKNETFPEMGRN